MRQNSALPVVLHCDAVAEGVDRPDVSVGLSVTLEDIEVPATIGFPEKAKRDDRKGS